MPPKSRLPADEVAILEEWVKRGAPDPRTDDATKAAKPKVVASEFMVISHVERYAATGDLVYTGDMVPPDAHEAGPRDVVKVPVGMTARVRMTFERDGLWMLHCHILEHEDYDMMRFFRVVASEEQLAADARLADSQSRAEAIISGRASRGGAHRHPRAGAKGAAL
jgi:hypothetical protein